MKHVLFDKLNERQKSFLKFILFNVFFIATTGAVVAISYYVGNKIGSFCFFKTVFGVFCPFCGGTRCAINILHLNFVEAFKYHPSTVLFFFYTMFAEVLFVVNFILKKEYLSFIYKKYDTAIIVYLVISIVQFFIRVVCFYNDINCPIMYTNI